MLKIRSLLALLCFVLFFGGGVPLFAQEHDENESEDDDAYYETDWDGYFPELYSRGDQTFTITLGLIFPTVFYRVHDKTVIDHNFTPPLGGAGSLAYTYFLGSHFFLGGEIGIKFNSTLRNHTIFLIPIGIRAGWQFVAKKFEFPLTFTIGLAPITYLDFEYAGLFLKGGASGFYRFSPEWSFGINTEWSWYPQRPYEYDHRAVKKDIDAHILGVTISARYHF